jgi:putative PEP-CTERM system TPR-repeat lipoprotein
MRIGMATGTLTVAAAIAAVLIAGCGGPPPDALLASGKDYLAKNDRSAAVIQFKNALQQNPRLAEARYLLGKALLEGGDFAAAEKELRKAMEYDYPAEEVMPPLAQSLAFLGRHKEVIDEFSKTQVAKPQGKAELQSALGRAYLGVGDASSAATAFNVALAAQPGYAPAQVGAAQTALIARDFSKALTMVDAALATAPKFAEAWYVKGDILLAEGRRDGALEAYRKSAEAQPDSVAAHSASVSLLIQDAKLEEAAKQLQSMRQVLPKHPQTVYLQALLAYRQKNLPAARQAIQQQLSIMPDHLPSLALAGSIEYELRSYPLAESYLLKVLQRAPQHTPSRGVLALTYLRLGEPAKALEVLKPELGKIERNAHMLAVAGETYMMNGDYAQAASYFAKAGAVDPSAKANRTAHAMTYMARGDVERGVRELEHAAAQDPDARPDLVLIATYMQRREFDKALKAIGGLEKKQPDNPAPHNLRGGIYLGLKDAAAARRSFERAVQLNPTYFPAADNLARLDLAEKKPQAARQRFEVILAKDPRQRDALLALAELRSREGGTSASPEVVALINRAIAVDPNELNPRLLLVSYHLQTKEPKKAVTAAQDALAAMPNRPEVYDAAGRAYQAAGELNQALAVYSKLSSLQPTSPLPYIRMAQLRLASKDKEAAAADLRKALELQRDHLGAQRGIIALDLDAGRQKEALAMAQQVQKQRPKDAVGYVFEGDIYATGKHWNEAVAAYRRGLKETGATYLATRLHDALSLSGNPAGAEQFAAGWLKEHAKDNAFRLHLAQTAGLRKDYAAAIQHYRKLLEQQPDNAELLNNLAWASAHVKDPKALEYAEQAYKLAPGQPAIMDTLGTLLVEKGDTTRGLELLRKAATLAPQAPEFRLNLAKGQIKAGQKDAARKELDELAKLGERFPRHAEVKQLKQEL